VKRVSRDINPPHQKNPRKPWRRTKDKEKRGEGRRGYQEVVRRPLEVRQKGGWGAQRNVEPLVQENKGRHVLQQQRLLGERNTSRERQAGVLACMSPVERGLAKPEEVFWGHRAGTAKNLVLGAGGVPRWAKPKKQLHSPRQRCSSMAGGHPPPRCQERKKIAQKSRTKDCDGLRKRPWCRRGTLPFVSSTA